MGTTNSARGVRLLALLIFMWGLTWPITKIALLQIDPWTLRVVGLNCGGIGLLLVAYFRGHSLSIRPDDIRPLLLVALFNISLWSISAAYGLTLLAAGRGIIIAYTMPVWSSILGVAILREQFDQRRLLGLTLALGGLAVLIAPAWQALDDAPVGVAALVFASLAWAIGTVAYKAVSWHNHVLVLAGWQLVLGAVPLMIGMMIIGHPGTLSTISLKTAAALAFIIVVPMFLCYYCWFRVIELLPASVASIGVSAVPVVGVLASAVLLQERIGPTEGIALVLIVVALWCVLARGSSTR